MEKQRFLFGVLNLFNLNQVISGFMTGAPDWTCKDPSTFHTLRLNASHEGIIMPQPMDTNPYVLEVDALTYYPGSRITVKIRGLTKDTAINGFFIQAIQANMSLTDLRRQPYGTFENTTLNERPSKCQPINGIPRGGATHNNSAPKESASVVWLAPETYNPGRIQFLATGVHDYSTYWTDIRSAILSPEGYPSQTDSKEFYWTPTATWYRWLQYVLQQQLLLDYISKSSNQGAEPVPKKADSAPQDNSINYSQAESQTKAAQEKKPVTYKHETTEAKSSSTKSFPKTFKTSTEKPMVR